MAKLRKMLGSIDDPCVVSLMRLMETQSKITLTRWAVQYGKMHYLPLLKKGEDCYRRLDQAVSSVEDYLRGTLTLKEVKSLLKDAREAAKGENDPIMQAAARAVSTACATVQTPTSALGFLFYGVAAVVYDSVGTEESQETYDTLASTEFTKILQSVREIAVADEENPVKIKWNC